MPDYYDSSAIPVAIAAMIAIGAFVMMVVAAFFSWLISDLLAAVMSARLRG